MGASLLALAKSIYYICFPGMRSSFIRLFRHGRCYSLHFIPFYTTEFNPWYNSFSFSLCFYWHLVSLLSHFGIVKTLLYFLRHFKFFKLFVASWPMLFIPWCCCCLSRRLLFIYLFSVCSIWLVFVTLSLFLLLLLFFWWQFWFSFSGVRSSLNLSVTLSIVTTLY